MILIITIFKLLMQTILNSNYEPNNHFMSELRPQVKRRLMIHHSKFNIDNNNTNGSIQRFMLNRDTANQRGVCHYQL
jgi:hypothetical protein